MNTEYRYLLESRRLTGRRQQKFQCPHCGKKSFVRYVDTYNNFSYVSDEVGKCDHENSCGYHYKPSEYFHDNAWLKEKIVHFYQPKPLPPPPPLMPLSMELVFRSHSPESTFWYWYSTEFAQKLCLSPDQVQCIYEDYYIGATNKRNIIFWQIDEQSRVRTGHIMQYYNDGKRHDGYQDWTHNRMMKKGQLSSDWTLYQCFFGQHLLPKRPEAHVCLVESEKTTLIMAAHQPQHLWLATSGSGGLNAEKVECLRGRRFTLFPDSGCFEKWQKVMQGTQGLAYTISDRLEQYPANTDLADLLLEPP